MHWSVNGSLLGLAGVLVFLVLGWGWDPMTAVFVIGSVGATISLGGLAVLFVLAKPEHRADLVRTFVSTVRADLANFLSAVGLRPNQ